MAVFWLTHYWDGCRRPNQRSFSYGQGAHPNKEIGMYVTILALCDRTVSYPKRAAAREQTKRKESVTVVVPRDREKERKRDRGCSARSCAMIFFFIHVQWKSKCGT